MRLVSASGKYDYEAISDNDNDVPGGVDGEGEYLE